MEKIRFEKSEPEYKRKKIRAIAILVLFFVAMGVLCFVAGKPMLDLFRDPSRVRAWVDQCGIWSRIAFIGMMAFQIVVAFIPGEPLEIAAGYAFGAWEGTLLCLLGAVIGGLVVFVAVRKYGRKLVELIYPIEKLDEMNFLKDEKRLGWTVFLLFFIPGTPKDIMTYFIGLTKMRLGTWLAISCTARIPSVVTSTIGGDALGVKNLWFAAIVFAVTILISVAGALVYRRFCKKRPDSGQQVSKIHSDSD